MKDPHTRNSFAIDLEYDKAHPQGSVGKYWWVLPSLVFPVVLLSVFDSVSHQRAFTAAANARFVSADQLKSFCNTGRVIKTDLYADQYGIKGEHGVDFAYLWMDFRHPTSRGTPGTWTKFTSAPQIISLFDENRTFSVKLDEKNINVSEIPFTFDDYGSRVADSIIPESWKEQMTERSTRYRVRAIPCGKKLRIAGTFWLSNEGMTVSGFEYKGLGKTEYESKVLIQ